MQKKKIAVTENCWISYLKSSNQQYPFKCGFKMFTGNHIKMYNFLSWVKKWSVKMLFVVLMYRNKVIVFLFGFALGFLFILNNT